MAERTCNFTTEVTEDTEDSGNAFGWLPLNWSKANPRLIAVQVFLRDLCDLRDESVAVQIICT
jgi:hypothetical protein